MNRMVQPATNKADFELVSLAVSAINRLRGLHACPRACGARGGGLTEEHVHEAVRIAATVSAAAVAYEMSEVPLVDATISAA